MKKTLVIEYNRDMEKRIAGLLQNKSFHYDIARNKKDIYSHLYQNDYHTAIVSNEMFGMNSNSMISILRSRGISNIILLTAFNHEEVFSSVTEKISHLRIPFSDKELLTLINKH